MHQWQWQCAMPLQARGCIVSTVEPTTTPREKTSVMYAQIGLGHHRPTLNHHHHEHRSADDAVMALPHPHQREFFFSCSLFRCPAVTDPPRRNTALTRPTATRCRRTTTSPLCSRNTRPLHRVPTSTVGLLLLSACPRCQSADDGQRTRMGRRRCCCCWPERCPCHSAVSSTASPSPYGCHWPIRGRRPLCM